MDRDVDHYKYSYDFEEREEQLRHEHPELFNGPPTPIDVLEPLKPRLTREQKARRTYAAVISYCLGYIERARNPYLATVALCYALGQHEITGGKSQRAFNKQLGFSHNTISKRVKEIHRKLEEIINDVNKL